MMQKPSFGAEQHEVGSVIIQQGAASETFYIITRGQVEVVEKRPSGETILLATLGPGDYFGEIGLLTQKVRMATVRAKTAVNLMSMNRQSFGSWLQSSRMIREELRELVKERLPDAELPQTFAAPAPIPTLNLDVSFFEMDRLDQLDYFLPGEIIMRQGETADKFYIITAGRVEVFITNEDGSETMLEELREGDYFGEVGLLEHGKRIASVRAKTEVRLIAFGRDSFLAWMAQNPASLDEIEETAQQRLADTGRLNAPSE